MANIFKSQSDLTINVDTGIDLTGATVMQILFTRPDKSKGSFNAAVSGTQLVYQPSANDFNQIGTYILQAFVTIGGRDAYGAFVSLVVVNTLK